MSTKNEFAESVVDVVATVIGLAAGRITMNLVAEKRGTPNGPVYDNTVLVSSMGVAVATCATTMIVGRKLIK